MRIARAMALSGLVLLGAAMPAWAKDATLQFKLLTQRISVVNELPTIAGHTITVGEYMGVAVFADGRLAHKSFVDVSDDTDSAGTFKGYSTYTFQDGASLTLGYSGGWDGNGLHGDYMVLSGTGTYAGAKGTGSFNGLDEPWGDANLFDVAIRLTLPE